MHGMDKIAVIIPCYNEELTIQSVVSDVKERLPEAVVYVYDNNSSDRTVEYAEKAGAVVRHEYMQGKGNVIRRMFREIDAACYVMVDGDNTYSLEKVRGYGHRRQAFLNVFSGEQAAVPQFRQFDGPVRDQPPVRL